MAALTERERNAGEIDERRRETRMLARIAIAELWKEDDRNGDEMLLRSALFKALAQVMVCGIQCRIWYMRLGTVLKIVWKKGIFCYIKIIIWYITANFPHCEQPEWFCKLPILRLERERSHEPAENDIRSEFPTGAINLSSKFSVVYDAHPRISTPIQSMYMYTYHTNSAANFWTSGMSL